MASDVRSVEPDLTGLPLRIETVRGSDGVTIAITGEIDMSTADRVSDAIADAKKSRGKVVVDLSDVCFLDSTALQVLLQASSQNEHDGHRLSFIPSKHDAVKRLLSISGTSEFLK